MLRYNDIVTELLHLVGWQQGYTNGVQIDNGLTASQSGIYFQQIHPLITLENIRSIAPEFNTVDDTEQTFSDWLTEKTKASIYKVISRFCTEKANQQAFKQLVESKELFSGTGNMYNTETPNNKLVGFEIVPIRSRGITTKIEKIGLQFTKAGAYTIYVFHSSSYEPIYKETFTTTKANTMCWITPNDWTLRYNQIDAGGSWYLVYAQSDMPTDSKAIIKDYDWSEKPCPTCSRINVLLYEAWSKYLEVHPFDIDLTDVPIDNDTLELRLWDVSKMHKDNYKTNHGINICVTVGCDITDFILEQKLLFADVVAKQVAIDMLKEFAYNPSVRTNRHAINASRLDILYALDGDSSSMKKSGLCYELDMAIKALDINTRGQDRICMPCANKGLKWSVV